MLLPLLEFKNFPFVNVGSLSILCGRGQRNPVRVYEKGDLFSVKWLNTKLTKV